MADRARARVGAVLFRARDPEALAEFYRAAFGLGEPRRGDDGHVGFALDNTYVGFDAAGGDGPGAPGRASIWFDVDDCRAVFDRLVGLGAAPCSPPDATCSPGETLATVADPEGNVIGLIGRG